MVNFIIGQRISVRCFQQFFTNSIPLLKATNGEKKRWTLLRVAIKTAYYWRCAHTKPKSINAG